MTNKQTALNWILDKLSPYIYYPYAHSAGYDLEELIEQVKAMEKEQIINAYLEGESDGDHLENSGENYYNQTYGQI